MSAKRGQFIVLEGSEGVGKSTNLVFVTRFLESRNITVRATREPGGTVLGEQLRSILLDKAQAGICPDAELLMMFAARAQHLQQVILPALTAGDWVVCDRFTDASYAYQGGGRQIPLSRIAELEQWVQGDLRPDLVILLDTDVAIGAGRAQTRSKADRFEMEQTAFFERVRSAYLARAQESPARYAVVNAELPLINVQEQIQTALEAFLEKVQVQ